MVLGGYLMVGYLDPEGSGFWNQEPQILGTWTL